MLGAHNCGYKNLPSAIRLHDGPYVGDGVLGRVLSRCFVHLRVWPVAKQRRLGESETERWLPGGVTAT